MKQRLSWKHIGEFFSGQWVELTDVEWKWNSPHPRLACVRHHAPDRASLLRMVKSAREIEGSVIMFIWPVQSVVRNFDDAVAF